MNAKLRGFCNLYRKHKITSYQQFREYLDAKHDYAHVNDYGDPYDKIYIDAYDPVTIYFDDGESIKKQHIV